jgi:IS30 family transposase
MNRAKQALWRKSQVLDLSSKGLSQADIARTLQVNESTISRDLLSLNTQARNNIRRYIDERLPAEYEKCIVGLTSILKEAWITAAKAEDKREKLQALSLAKECYAMKLELLTNATVVDDAIKFVNERTTSSKKDSRVVTQEDESETTTTTASVTDDAAAVIAKNQIF